MKTSKIYLYLIIALTLTGCKPDSRKVETKIKIKSNKEVVKVKIPENIDNDFKVFIDYFNKDSIFQVSRVFFPLKVNEVNDNNMLESIEMIITKDDYTVLDLEYPKDALTRDYDKYTQKIKTNGEKTIIEIRGIDNGICTDFIFEKIKGKWFLKSWNDKSN